LEPKYLQTGNRTLELLSLVEQTSTFLTYFNEELVKQDEISQPFGSFHYHVNDYIQTQKDLFLNDENILTRQSSVIVLLNYLVGKPLAFEYLDLSLRFIEGKQISSFVYSNKRQKRALALDFILLKVISAFRDLNFEHKG
jgi:hypothetical protein